MLYVVYLHKTSFVFYAELEVKLIFDWFGMIHARITKIKKKKTVYINYSFSEKYKGIGTYTHIHNESIQSTQT